MGEHGMDFPQVLAVTEKAVVNIENCFPLDIEG
jgi:hypothetical protein